MRRDVVKRFPAVFCAWVCSATLAKGVALLVDSFDYSNGPLVTVSAGAWAHHNGSTTGEVAVVAGRVFLTQADTEAVSASLAGQPYPATTNVFLYASFTLNV